MITSSLGSRCTTTTLSLMCSSLQPKENHSAGVPPPSLNSQNNGKPKDMQRQPRIRNNANQKSQKTTSRKPSVADMEKAIGAGMFRDRDAKGSGEKKTLFDLMSSSPVSKPEGALEKKLRKTGEWILDATEGGPSRSSSHEILMVVCIGILPVWLLFLLIASGTLKLPFSDPVLDDLLM